MSMTSATPWIVGQDSISAISDALNSAPAISMPGADGTQDGASVSTRSGRSLAASVAQRTPSSPATLPTSCGSQTTVVVPCGTTTSA